MLAHVGENPTTLNDDSYSRKQQDATSSWTRELIAKLNSTEEAERLLKGRYQSVNFWKPLRGPNRDWPLALCDLRTVDADDLEPCDLVYANYVVENCQVHWTQKQTWYYLSDQLPSEAILFRQTDSAEPYMPGVPHSSYLNPLSTPEDAPRESVEVRAIVYYSD